MIELCVPYRGNQLSLQSDTRFSSYNGSKVGFDTFLAITLCVYIGAYNNFKTECPSSMGTFLIKNVMSSKVIQGRLWAKRTNMLILGDMEQRKKSLSIFWYMIALCVPYRGNQLSLQSDTWFSSYKGSKVGFDTLLAITLCVYIGAYNNFETECTSSRGTFLIKNVMSSKVIQGRKWAKRKNMLILEVI